MGFDFRQESAAVTGAVGRALDLLAGYGRGDTVPWPLIEEAAGFPAYSLHWAAFIRRLRKRMLTPECGGVWLRAVHRVGLKLLTEAEQLREQPRHRQRKAVRQFTRARAELAALPDEGLSPRQREEKYVRLQALRDERRKILAGLRTAAALFGPPRSAAPPCRA